MENTFYTELLECLTEDNGYHLSPEEFKWVHDYLMDYAFQLLYNGGDEAMEEIMEAYKEQKEYEENNKKIMKHV